MDDAPTAGVDADAITRGRARDRSGECCPNLRASVSISGTSRRAIVGANLDPDSRAVRQNLHKAVKAVK